MFITSNWPVNKQQYLEGAVIKIVITMRRKSRN